MGMNDSKTQESWRGNGAADGGRLSRPAAKGYTASRALLGGLFWVPLLALQAPAAALAQTPAPAPSTAPAAAPEPLKVGTARTLPSGVEITLTRAGRAPLSYPSATDSVKVHYEGTFEDGRVFDSSYERKQAATFPLNRVIACWTQGVQNIPVGGAATLNCPASSAYGERGAGGGRIPPNTPLRFKVELLEIVGR
jgi:FKBP-type peptidyl-prolyl cis-trans isomerase FkpA